MVSYGQTVESLSAHLMKMNAAGATSSAWLPDAELHQPTTAGIICSSWPLVSAPVQFTDGAGSEQVESSAYDFGVTISHASLGLNPTAFPSNCDTNG